MSHPELYKLTHHCCQCNKIKLLSGEWLPAVIVKIQNVKPSHGFCPTCLEWQLNRIKTKRGLSYDL
jgi:hypothetical protein